MMKRGSIQVNYKEYKDIKELPAGDRALLEKARKAASDAYAPYSHFQVGAAVKLENGKVVTGNNQENAAYPSGMCAERVALFAASAKHPGVAVAALAITASSGEFIIDYPVSPCGACRQVMAEYENHHKKNIRLILAGESGKVRVFNDISSLLPFGFNADQLRPKKTR